VRLFGGGRTLVSAAIERAIWSTEQEFISLRVLFRLGHRQAFWRDVHFIQI
jgi:hypothetical protein